MGRPCVLRAGLPLAKPLGERVALGHTWAVAGQIHVHWSTFADVFIQFECRTDACRLCLGIGDIGPVSSPRPPSPSISPIAPGGPRRCDTSLYATGEEDRM